MAFVNVVIIGRSSAAGMMQEGWYNGVYRHYGLGRLVPGDGGCIRVILDEKGEIGVIPVPDILLLLEGFAPDGLALSESGNRVIITGLSAGEIVALTISG